MTKAELKAEATKSLEYNKRMKSVCVAPDGKVFTSKSLAVNHCHSTKQDPKGCEEFNRCDCGLEAKATEPAKDPVLEVVKGPELAKELEAMEWHALQSWADDNGYDWSLGKKKVNIIAFFEKEDSTGSTEGE